MYEVVFSNAAFHWLYPDYIESLRKIESMLSPEGCAYVVTAGKNAGSQAFDDFIDNKFSNSLVNLNYQSFSKRRLTLEDFQKLCKSTSLSIMDSFILERKMEIKITDYIVGLFLVAYFGI